MHVQNTVWTKRVALCHQNQKGKIFGVIFYDYSFALVSCTEVKASFKVGLKGGMSHTHTPPLTPLEPHLKSWLLIPYKIYEFGYWSAVRWVRTLQVRLSAYHWMVSLQIASMGMVMQDTSVSARISWNTRKCTFVLLLNKKYRNYLIEVFVHIVSLKISWRFSCEQFFHHSFLMLQHIFVSLKAIQLN